MKFDILYKIENNFYEHKALQLQKRAVYRRSVERHNALVFSLKPIGFFMLVFIKTKLHKMHIIFEHPRCINDIEKMYGFVI